MRLSVTMYKLALLLMTAAISAGYHIPEDLAITGCDHSEEGQNLTPSLTTVSFPVYELGEASVEKLMKLIHEENVPAITVYMHRWFWKIPVDAVLQKRLLLFTLSRN